MNINVTEIVAESKISWKDAVQKAIDSTASRIPNITGVEIYNLTAGVENGQITDYKANVKLAYIDNGQRGDIL